MKHAREALGISEVGKMPAGSLLAGISPMRSADVDGILKSVRHAQLQFAIFSQGQVDKVLDAMHPATRNCIKAACDVLHNAACSAGAPRGIIAFIPAPAIEGTQALMKHPETNLAEHIKRLESRP